MSSIAEATTEATHRGRLSCNHLRLYSTGRSGRSVWIRATCGSHCDPLFWQRRAFVSILDPHGILAISRGSAEVLSSQCSIRDKITTECDESARARIDLLWLIASAWTGVLRARSRHPFAGPVSTAHGAMRVQSTGSGDCQGVEVKRYRSRRFGRAILRLAGN